MGANAVSDDVRRGAGSDASSLDAWTLAAWTLDERILDATTRCVARWGVSKTTIDDIAREAGCSRATIYRTLPGGRQALLVAAAHHEVGRALRTLERRLAACSDLRGVLLTLVHDGACYVAGSDALTYLVEHEPEVIRPHVSFDGVEPLLHRVAEFAAPHIGRFVEPDTAWRTGEWMARLVTSYVFGDDPILDLTDRDRAAHVIDAYVLPGLIPAQPPTQPPTVATGDH